MEPRPDALATSEQIALTQPLPGAYFEPSALAEPVSSQHALSHALRSRAAEFTCPQRLRVKVGSWNVAARKETAHDVAGWFVEGKGIAESLSGLALEDDQRHSRINVDGLAHRENVSHQETNFSNNGPTLPRNDVSMVAGGDQVDLYVLGLQEIVDVGSATEAFRPYSDNTAASRYREALENALPAGYQLVAEQQLVGLYNLVYASPDLASQIRSVSTQSVGTGLMGYMGNKGAVTTRIVVGETTRLVFVNCHMSAGLGNAELERRNWDAQQILQRTRFAPVVDSLGIEEAIGEKIGDEHFAFWLGDLNYRLEGIPGDDVRRLLTLHTRNEYDLNSRVGQKINEQAEEQRDASGSNESSYRRSFQSQHSWSSADDTILEDPASLQTTIDSLLPHDELRQQIAKRRVFHDGWREGSISFLPTYKYDVGSIGIFDSSDKRRGPSWCDRILFRTRDDLTRHNEEVREQDDAKKRDEYLKAQGVDKAADDEDTLFEYDPDADGDGDGDGDADGDNDAVGDCDTGGQDSGAQDSNDTLLCLEQYIAHQRVLSSDHKPLTALFTLQYDAVVQELKTKVHQEVARDMDRAENEGRPSLTLVVDNICEDADAHQSIAFGPVRYGDCHARSVTMANTGRVDAIFGFVERPMGSPAKAQIAQDWLSVHLDAQVFTLKKKQKRELAEDVTEFFSLEPGETCTVEITLNITDKGLVKPLNNGDPLEDVLVLRVVNGRDHFLPVRAQWQQSFLYRSIEELCCLPEGGVRVQQQQQRQANDNEPKPDLSPKISRSSPRELFKLTEMLEKLAERLLAEQTMLQRNGSELELPWAKYSGWPFVSLSWQSNAERRAQVSLDVREALDCDEEIEAKISSDADVTLRLEAVAATLMEFLESLEDGIISKQLFTKLDDEFLAHMASEAGLDVDDKRARILEILSVSRSHSVSFVFVTSMLAHVAHEIASSTQEMPALTRVGSDLPKASLATVPRKSLHADAGIARRQLVRKEYAALFSEAMIRYPQQDNAKNMAAQLQRGRELVELFLETSPG